MRLSKKTKKAVVSVAEGVILIAGAVIAVLSAERISKHTEIIVE